MAIFSKKPNRVGGSMDEIRCDESSYLIWKWRPSGVKLGDCNRENAIRYGSSLRVKDGEVAVFVYNQKNGVMQDYIKGPFDQKIKTANLPVLASIIGLAFEGGTPFQAEIYFINLAKIVQIRFAVPFFDVFDPRFTDYSVPVAARGTISFKISDYLKFIELHRLINFDLNDFEKQIRDAVSRYVKNIVANTPATCNIPVVQIENKISDINDRVEIDVKERLQNDFGVEVSGVDIGAVDIDKSSPGYVELSRVTRQATTATIEAQTAANIKNIFDKQRIEAVDYAESLRIQREEGQYAKHKQTQSGNLAAYQTEAQTEVGVAGANALGKMGANGAGGINIGGGGGFNPTAMMAGMALGGAIGQNVAGIMNGAMSGINAPSQNAVPPPIPEEKFFVAVNKNPTGPYDIDSLKQMAQSGKFDGQSLVWKPGFSEWAKAETIDALKEAVANAIPPIPD